VVTATDEGQHPYRSTSCYVYLLHYNIGIDSIPGLIISLKNPLLTENTARRRNLFITRG